MFVLKFRVPYKLANIEEIQKELEEQFHDVDDACVLISNTDETVDILINNGRAADRVYDVRLLNIY